ncbi:hypothetical protein [Streptomyces olivochromogenes]|uniref:hypothetical protein n=1 Tax=Streptomyces olivochromogenes TaxID=1963 RepID=UPI0036C09BA8
MGAFKLTDVIPAPGYVIGALTAWSIQIPPLPRTPFYAPLRTRLEPGYGLRFGAAISLFLYLGVDYSYLVGLLWGQSLLYIFLMIGKTRFQLTGALMRVVVPILLAALLIGIFLNLSKASGSDAFAWWYLLAYSILPMAIIRSIPYGKKLSWQSSWNFPYPRTTPPALSWKYTNQVRPYSFIPGQKPLRGIAMWLAGRAAW